MIKQEKTLKVTIQTTERHRFTTEVLMTQAEFDALDDLSDEDLFDKYVNRDTDFDDSCDQEIINLIAQPHFEKVKP